MKATTIAMVLLLGAMGCSSQQKKVTERDKLINRDGLLYEINSEEPFTGTMVEYWSNGQKKIEIEYRDGKQHGMKTSWYESGQKVWEGEYRDGLCNGKVTFWYENGQKVWESEARGGKFNGKWTYWWPNGNKLAEVEYRNGEAIRGREWDEDGNLITEK